MTKPICCKNEEVEINKDNIWEGDLFSRNKVAEDFTKIITSINQPYILSINANYGSGKTFFLKRWAEELKQKGEKVVFFNAWDCDFVEKPLLPFLYNFIEQLKQQGLVKYDFNKDVKNSINILSFWFKKLIYKSSLETLNIDDLLEKTCAHSISIPMLKSLKDYQKLQNIMIDFKNGITEVISKLNDKNIYIFVDELERCRPIFAIELLEAIKHLFNVKGLVFILGIDRSQLKHTISNIYGCGMDGEGYLRRFIDLELELPKPNIKIFTNYLQQKFEIKNNLENTNQNWAIDYNEFNKYFNLFANLYPMQLRDIEQVYAKFNLITKMIDENKNKIMPILALLLVLKIKDTTLYDQFNLENLSYEKINKFLETNIFSKLLNQSKEQDFEIKSFIKICRGISRDNYSEILENSNDDQNLEYQHVVSIQKTLDPFNNDWVQYLKNMISYINVA